MSTETVDVVIVGAGAAGLAAFRHLDGAGKRVLCLEARDRIGGRIYTIHDPMSPIPIELGAEFVHGRPPEILRVVESAALKLYACQEHAVHIRDGRARGNEDAWLQVDDVMKGMEAAVKEGREETFADFIGRSNYSDDAKQLATSYVEGFNAARREIIGIQSIVKDAKAADQIDGDRAFRIMDGYDAVPRWFTQGVETLSRKLMLNCPVQAIRWMRGRAEVDFLSVATGAMRSVTATQVIITVPLGVLQAEPGSMGAIRFQPEIPNIVAAAKRLRFGQVVRMILRFDEPLWEENEELAEAGFLLSNERHFPTWWTPLPVRARSITAWSSGRRPDELLGLPKTELVNRSLHDLGRILHIDEDKLHALLRAVYFHDWQQDPFSRGAYSYVPAHAMTAREILAEPVADTLFFAGEATELNGHSATVHGAIASGVRAARQIAPIGHL